MARLEVDWAFLRSARGGLKIVRTLVALIAFTCFRGVGAHGAYAALLNTEAAISGLFLLLYLLKLNTRMRFLYWPLADIFNSAISALFLLAMNAFALITKTSKATLSGEVFGVMLLVLCIVDIVLLWRKISQDIARGTSAPAQ